MKPSFERIIGGTEKQKKKIEQAAEKSSAKSGEELFGEHLIAPTQEENHAIGTAVAYANSIAKHYGATRQFNADRIFLLKSGSVESMTDGKIKGAVCNPFSQSIAVERLPSNALIASSVIHEMFHMDSYHSAQVVKKPWFLIFEKIEGIPYRSGIQMRGREGEGDYFGFAEEAIIATLSRRFFNEVIAHDQLYREEIERTTKIKEWLLTFAEKYITEENKKQKFIAAVQDILILPESENVYREMCTSDKEDGFRFGFFMGYYDKNLKSGHIFHERAKEREKFDMVLDKIVAESQGMIQDRNQLFDTFARAHFTGNYLPLARMIEGSLGKGAFRKIAIELGEMKENEAV